MADAYMHRHRVCGATDPTTDHQCGQDREHTGQHRCPCGETWWRS